MTTSLKGHTAFITGASRGIGRSVALRYARAGANIVIVAKSVEENAQLGGTIYSVAKEVESFGVAALPIACDIRDDAMIDNAVKQTIARFGRLDILVNNASAITLMPTTDITMRRFDLMFDVNVRATFACARACFPYLKNSENAHVLTLSPPIDLDPKWFKNHLAYTMSKYGMSFCTLGLAAEWASHHISVNSLWPKTTIATAAVANLFPKAILRASRTPEIVSDAAYSIVSKTPKVTGRFLIDEVVLRESGMTDFSAYAVDPTVPLMQDLFLPEEST